MPRSKLSPKRIAEINEKFNQSKLTPPPRISWYETMFLVDVVCTGGICRPPKGAGAGAKRLAKAKLISKVEGGYRSTQAGIRLVKTFALKLNRTVS